MSFTAGTYISLAIVAFASIAISSKAVAVDRIWQVGFNAGVSRLTPETEGSDFTLEDDQSTAASIYVGVDLNPIIAAELAFTSLGEASLSDNEDISYQAISLGATAYIWGEKESYRRAKGVSGYARLGFNAILNESDIELDESDNVALLFGLGVQYPFSDNWGMRAEITNFDGDAQALMAGVFWRTGETRRDEGKALTGASRPVPATEPVDAEPVTTPDSLPSESDTAPEPVVPDTTQPAQPTPSQGSLIQEVSPEPVQPEVTAPVTGNNELAARAGSACPASVLVKVPDPQACAVLNGVVEGLDFLVDTAKLTSSSTILLDRIVAAMIDNPSVVLEIRAHAQSLANAPAQQQLSSLRARAVARYLVQNGVPVSRLRAKAFGDTQPIVDTTNSAGIRINNRIELRVL